jgi:hypothetical protein
MVSANFEAAAKTPFALLGGLAPRSAACVPAHSRRGFSRPARVSLQSPERVLIPPEDSPYAGET